MSNPYTNTIQRWLWQVGYDFGYWFAGFPIGRWVAHKWWGDPS